MVDLWEKFRLQTINNSSKSTTGKGVRVMLKCVERICNYKGVIVLTDDELKQRAIKFQEQIQTLIDNAKSTTPKAVASELDVTLNLRVNKRLRADFDRLCRSKHTNMSREIKRYMSLAVKANDLIK